MRLDPGATFGPGYHINGNLPAGLQCPVCTRKFDAVTHNQIVCGNRCKRIRANDLQRAKYIKAKAALKGRTNAR